MKTYIITEIMHLLMYHILFLSLNRLYCEHGYFWKPFLLNIKPIPDFHMMIFKENKNVYYDYKLYIM